MSINEKLLAVIRKKIAEEIQKELLEISTTGAVAGYLTPKAFSPNGGVNKERVKTMAKRIGYSLTHRGEEDAKRVDKVMERYQVVKKELHTIAENYYYEYKNDSSKLPHQKIGQAIAEVNKQLKLIERVLKMNHRLKKESGVSSDRLWKRTQHQMTKLEGKLVELAGRLREMRG